MSKSFTLDGKTVPFTDGQTIIQAALDQTDIALAHFLDVGEGRAIELDQLHQIEQALVDIQKGHMATEATCQGGSRQLEFLLLRCHVSLPSWPCGCPRIRRSAACRRYARR